MKNVLGYGWDERGLSFFFRFVIPLMGKTRNMDGMTDEGQHAAVWSIYLHRILTDRLTGFGAGGGVGFLWIWGWEVMKMIQCERSACTIGIFCWA